MAVMRPVVTLSLYRYCIIYSTGRAGGGVTGSKPRNRGVEGSKLGQKDSLKVR